jgi:hypothetical protein
MTNRVRRFDVVKDTATGHCQKMEAVFIVNEDVKTLHTTKSFLLAKGIYGRFLVNEKGRIELAILIDDTTSQTDLRQGWGAIEMAKQALHEFQGSDMENVINGVRISKAAMIQTEGYSYTEVAMDINFDCLVNLCRSVEHLNNANHKAALFDIVATKILLTTMRMKDREAYEWITTGLSEIQEGRAPWTLNRGPIDKQRVRDAIRQLEREFRSKQIIIKSSPKTKMVKAKDLINPITEKAHERANALLNREPNSGGLERLIACHTKHLSKGKFTTLGSVINFPPD